MHLAVNCNTCWVFATKSFTHCFILHVSINTLSPSDCYILNTQKHVTSVEQDVALLHGRAFAHGVMGHRINPSWWPHWAIFFFQPVLHDWCNNGCAMYYPVCGMMHIKEPLLLIGRVTHMAAVGFLSCYLSGPLQYAWWHIFINKMCWVHH